MNGFPPTSDVPPELTTIVEAAEHYLRQGEPLLAYNTVQTGLVSWPDSLRLRQLMGLSAARTGDTWRANQLLSQLSAEGACDAETLGMLARTHKDLALRSKEPAVQNQNFQSAFRIYGEAYKAAVVAERPMDACYTGINAATIAVLLKDLPRARQIAREVRELCLRTIMTVPPTAEYWLEATVGEAALILGDEKESIAHYKSAARLARGRFGDLASTRRQAELLSTTLGQSSEWIRDVLSIPPVVMFAGHLIDRSTRRIPRLASDMASSIAESIHKSLEPIRPVAAYGSVACSTDILVFEALQNLGSEIHIILPFPAADLRRASVEVAAGDWAGRFDKLLGSADSVTVTSDYIARDSAATFEYANLVLTGMARLRARSLGTELRGVADWDRIPIVDGGGTASPSHLWEGNAIAVRKTALPEPDAKIQLNQTSALCDKYREKQRSEFSHELRSMLFADVVGYSTLSEDQTLSFIEQFLGAVARLIAGSKHRPEHVETTGDGLYMVFTSAAAAGVFALSLRELVARTNWTEFGLPAKLAIRIALHSGPVHCGRNPVTGSALYTGPHTSKTARIEPITPPGEVYASSAFAAVATATGDANFSMQYIGRVSLAKGYGQLGLYHLSASDHQGGPAEH